MAHSKENRSWVLLCYNNFILFIYFIYNQIPPQSEENNMQHKKNIDKILV